METSDLIRSLSADFAPTPRRSVERRVAIGISIGAVATFGMMLFGLGFRPDLAQAVYGPTIYMKWGYTIALGLVAVAATMHLSRPDAPRRHWLWLALIPVGLLAGIAIVQLATTPRADWMGLWLGHSWRQCPFRVTVLSVPIFMGLLWAFRRLAPTRLRAAGAAAGFASGACAATIYGFACPETSALFVVTWYSFGIAAATAIGAAIGPRLLRW